MNCLRLVRGNPKTYRAGRRASARMRLYRLGRWLSGRRVVRRAPRRRFVLPDVQDGMAARWDRYWREHRC